MTKIQQCKTLYNQAFGSEPTFDSMLFDSFFDCVQTLETDGQISAMYFKIPCVLNQKDQRSKAYYIYAVTTDIKFRHQGLMSKLFCETQTENDVLYFLKPSSDGVIKFYEQAGFKQIVGTGDDCDASIEVDDNFKKLSSLCDKVKGCYPIMIKGNTDIKKLNFKYTLE